MARIPIDHPLFERLKTLDRIAARQFPSGCDEGFGSLGLMFSKELDEDRYSFITPENCATFARTGGEGVHFSFLLNEGRVRKDSPIVITVPMYPMNYVVGECLYDFLCFGFYLGFFALEQLAYQLDVALEAFTDPHWNSTKTYRDSVGFVLSEGKRPVLEYLRKELVLQPWCNSSRFNSLQEKYSGLLIVPSDG